MLALIVIASVVACSQVVSSEKPPGCSANPTPSLTAEEYCTAACDNCFSKNGASLLTVGCKTSCQSAWYGLPVASNILVDLGVDNANGLLPLNMHWKCDNPNGNQHLVCQYACTCTGDNSDTCIDRCTRSAAANTYNTLF